MMQDAEQVPSGLTTALLYARRGSQATAPLVMECIIASVRAAIHTYVVAGRELPDTYEDLLVGYWRPAEPRAPTEFCPLAIVHDTPVMATAVATIVTTRAEMD